MSDTVTTRWGVALARPTRFGGWWAPVAVIVGLGILEQILVTTDVLPANSVPSTTQILGAMWDQVTSAELWSSAWDTAFSSALGFVIAVVVAIPVGFLLGAIPWLYRSLRAVIEFVRPIPPVTIIPLAILLFGTRLDMKLVIIVFGCFWPMLMQVIAGVLDVDNVASDTARVFGIRGLARFRHVVLPSAAPYIATGMRLIANFAVGLSIVSELVGGAAGIGLQIYTAELGGRSATVFALVILTGLLVLGVDRLFRLFEARALRWHESFRPRES